jgi:hypothetical protein
MSASVFIRVPLFVSDHQVLLAGDAQAVLGPMAPGSTGIVRACGMPVRPYQAGCRLLEVHARACRYAARHRYRRDPGLVPNPGQNPKVNA